MSLNEHTMPPEKKPSFIVVWDDQQGLCVPMCWDDDCEGAICGCYAGVFRAAMFESRQAARRAIDISAKYAALLKSQDKPYSDDFLGAARKCLRIVALDRRNRKSMTPTGGTR